MEKATTPSTEVQIQTAILSSSDSDSSDSSSGCVTGWPWQIGNRTQFESDSSSEDSSDLSTVEENTNASWTNRRNIFISVYNTNNYKDIILITNYNELHNYREKYSKIPKKSAENIKNIWSDIKVNVPELGIIPLKSYEKELIEDPKIKNKTVMNTITVTKQNGSVVDKTKSPVVTQIQSSKAPTKPSNAQQITIKVDNTTGNTTQVNAINVANKNIKEKNSNEPTKSKENSSNVKIKNKENVSYQKKTNEAPTKVAKSTEVNKTVPVSTSTKVDKQDKGVKVDIVLNVTKSESDKKNKRQATNSTVQLNGNDKNVKNNSSEQEFKKPQTKSNSKKSKNNKSNTTEIISETKSNKRKQKNSNSQSSENSDIQKRSRSVDSHSTLKEKSKKKLEESDNDMSRSDDEDEEIIDNMDVLTGNSKAVDHKMLELIKCKDKSKPVETPKVAEKKMNEKSNIEQNIVVTTVKNDLSSSTFEKNYIFHSEKCAEDFVDMIMDNNLIGGLESLGEAMQFNPGDDRHYLNRCYCYLRMNKAALALADAQYVLQTSSHYGHRFIGYLRAGKASMALQKYTQAENYFKDSISINADNVYAQREYMRAKIARIVSLGYSERTAVLALLKYSKTQEAINYLANKSIANKEDKSDNNDKNYDDIENLDDLVYSSDEDEKPNCTSLINSMLNYEPLVTKLSHLLAKPINMTTNTSLPPSKNANGDIKKKNTTNGKITGQVMEKTIWVGSLTKNITETMLKKKFKQYGNVISVYCPPNEAYAFVNFEKSEHVVNVLKNSSTHEINGQKLIIRQGIQKN